MLKARASRAYLATIFTALAAVFLISAASSQAAEREVLKPVAKMKGSLAFAVDARPQAVKRAKLKLRKTKRAQRRGKRGLKRKIKVRRVRLAAKNDSPLKLSKPRWAKGGKLKLVVKEDDSSANGSGGDSGSSSGGDSGSTDSQFGRMIAEDDASQLDPTNEWKAFQAFSMDSSLEERLAKRQVHRSSGGPEGAPYRELILKEGDDYYNERTELGANSQDAADTFQVYREGERKVTEGWFRFNGGYNGNGGGWQMKQAATGSGSSHHANPPVLQLKFDDRFDGDRWVLLQNINRNPTVLWKSEIQPRGEWLHVALDVSYSQDPSKGKITVYMGGENEPLTKVEEVTGVATLLTEENTGAPTPQGGAMPSHLRSGIYQQKPFGDNEMDLGPTRVYDAGV